MGAWVLIRGNWYNLQPRFRIGLPQTGVVVSTRWRIGWPQCEVGSFASSPILPAVGAPAISTRGWDLVAVPLTALGVSGNGACTLLWSGMVPQAAPAGVNQTLLQIDGGSDGTRIALRMAAGGTTLVLVPVTAGIEGTAVSAGSVVAGSPFRVGLSINGSGRVAASLNGAAAVVLEGAPASGLTTLRLSNSATGTETLFGEVAAMRLRPFALSDAGLADAVAVSEN
jgi:hypothetical protein